MFSPLDSSFHFSVSRSTLPPLCLLPPHPRLPHPSSDSSTGPYGSCWDAACSALQKPGPVLAASVCVCGCSGHHGVRVRGGHDHLTDLRSTTASTQNQPSSGSSHPRTSKLLKMGYLNCLTFDLCSSINAMCIPPPPPKKRRFHPFCV